MVEDRGWLPIREQLGYKYALSVDGNTASTRLAMLLASDQVWGAVACCGAKCSEPCAELRGTASSWLAG